MQIKVSRVRYYSYGADHELISKNPDAGTGMIWNWERAEKNTTNVVLINTCCTTIPNESSLILELSKTRRFLVIIIYSGVS